MIAIVGGGASGLMAAITAARLGAKVDIYEHNDKVGKKILASGNGRCNISNISLSNEDYFGRHPSFASFALGQFDFDSFKRFCASIGLLLEIKSDGKVYPMSNEAKSVQEALHREIDHLGINIHTKTSVSSITKHAGTFVVSAKNNREYKKVLIASGSPAAPQLGADKSGLDMARSLGHTVVDSYPALVGLHLGGKEHERMNGVKIRGEVSLFVDNKKVAASKNDILFTSYGVSGFAILDISLLASHALTLGKKVTLGVNLLPDIQRQPLVSQIKRLIKAVPYSTIESLLHGLLARKAAHSLLKILKIDTYTQADKINEKMIRQIASKIMDWRFEVEDTHGYKHAEVSGGGIETLEIDDKTMQSKIVPNLYFAGEILDITGCRGGYNLHFAWASGFLAAKAMSKR